MEKIARVELEFIMGSYWSRKVSNMREIYIIGAGGFGREVQWLIERINDMKPVWKIGGYIDDNQTGIVNGHPIVGTVESFLHTYENFQKQIAVVCAIGNSKIRKKVIEKFSFVNWVEFPNLIDPSVLMSDRIHIGKGNIVCAGNILTVDITLGDFNIINLDCTVGHDAEIRDFVTLYPSVNISGAITLEQCVEIGTGAHIIQGLSVGYESIIGAGSVVIRDVPAGCTAVGNPCRVIKCEKSIVKDSQDDCNCTGDKLLIKQ